MGSASRLRDVQADVLDAHEVIAGGEGLGDCEGDGGGVCRNYISISLYDCERDRELCLPIVGHVRPLEAKDEGPWPKILNHTLPEPSHVATFAPEGTLARYTWAGPGW